MIEQHEGADERLLTVEEVAARVRVNGDTVRRWLRNGELRGIKLSNKAGYRIRPDDLEAFLRSRENA